MNTVPDRPVSTLRVADELTVYTAAAQKERFVQALQSERPGLDLDLSEVAEIDTAGIQLLLMAQKALSSRGGHLRVVAASGAVHGTLKLLDLESLLSTQAAHDAACNLQPRDGAAEGAASWT